MDVAALVVSLCALGLTVYQAYLSREHNRISVRPSLSTFYDIDPAPDNPRITLVSIKLKNSGLGPAVIKSFEILVEGEAVTVKSPDEMHRLVLKHLTGHIVEDRCRFVVLVKHYVMAQDASEEIALIAIRDITLEQSEVLKKLALRVSFESAYGEPFTYDTRKHFELV